jgi:integrase
MTASNCEAWAAKRGAGIAASTYNNERDTIIAILNFAKREGLLLDNPALVLPRRKLGKSGVVIPSKVEFETLVAKMRSLDVRYENGANLVELLAYSGMRLAEATSILWRDVDFSNGRFTVSGGELGTKYHEARVVP